MGTEEEILVGADCKTLLESLEQIRKRTDAAIVLKKGERGAIVYPGKISNPIVGRPLTVEVLNVLGAGDAFMSGLLMGYLNKLPWNKCLDFANANGALVVSRHGCAPAMPYLDELQVFMQSPKDIEKIDHIHRSLEKYPKMDSLYLLAFDHQQFFDGLETKKICQFKSLIYQAAKNCSQKNIGIIIDDKYGREIVQDAIKENVILCKKLEKQESDELHFLDNKSAGMILRSWPKETIVKVLCYVKEDSYFQENQIAKLIELSEASIASGHKTIVEPVCKDNDAEQIYQFMFLCYTNNIFPTWWKLSPSDDIETFGKIDQLIEKFDPYCQGIVILGGNNQLDILGKQIRQIKKVTKRVIGFAVGRAIWGEISKKWFSGKIDDSQAISRVKENFNYLIKEAGYDGFDQKKGFQDILDSSAKLDFISHKAKS